MKSNNYIFLIIIGFVIFSIVGYLEADQYKGEAEFYKNALEKATGYKVTEKGYITFVDSAGQILTMQKMSDSLNVLNREIEKQRIVIENLKEFGKIEYSAKDSGAYIVTKMWQIVPRKKKVK